MTDPTAHHRSVRAFHERIASDYERRRYGRPSVTQLSYLVRRDLALRMIERVRGRILDVGCGPGTYSLQLHRDDRLLFAADASLNMVQELRRATSSRGVVVRALNSDIVHLAIRTNSMDGLLCIGVMGYIAEPRHALAELHRVLAPGGVAVIQVSNAASVNEWLYEWALPQLRRRLGLPKTSGYGAAFDVRAYTKRRFDRLLREQGFELIDWDFYNFHIPALERISASLAVRLSRQLQRVSRWRCFRPAASGYLALVRKPPATVSG